MRREADLAFQRLLEAIRRRWEDPALPRSLLLSVVILLTAIGIVMVFSASFYQKGVEGDAFYFLRRHLLWIPVAALTAMVVYQFDYRWLAHWYPWVYLLTVILLLLVLVPGLGIMVNQSRRWLPVGNLQFQPSELAKLAAIVFIAGFLSSNPDRRRQFLRGFVPLTGAISVLFFLVLVEPDFGTAMFILGLSGLVIVLSGLRKTYLTASAALFLPVIGGYVFLRWDMIQNRLLGFLEPEKVYQVRQSLSALGSGGWFGLGLGAGKHKLKYLPEPYTDFVLSVIGEELGFLGTLGVVLLFVLLLWVSIGIACRAADYFGFLLAAGITLSLAMQAATNIAVVTASVPTKGIPLPFLSSGGSGLCMTFAQIGLLLSIDRRRRMGTAGSPAEGGARES